MAYTTVAAVKTYLGTASSADDELLGDLIGRAQAFIENEAMTGRVFEASQDTTRRFDAGRNVAHDELGVRRVLYLDRDLCQITSIANGDGTAITSGQYVTEPRNATPWYAIRLKRSANVAWTFVDDPEDAISIVGRWAYSTTAPTDVAQACIDLVVYLYRRRGTDGGKLDMPQVSPSGVMIYPPGFPQTVKDVREAYRKLVG